MGSIAAGAAAFSLVLIAVVSCSSYGEESGTTPNACTSSCEVDACGLVRLACGPADCGTCSNPLHRCVDNKCRCVPKTCQELGVQCGATADGCGGEVFCGACTTPLTCGSSNACSNAVCVPKDAAAACAGKLCGKQPDGCGGVVDCGTEVCTGQDSCGGGGKPGECGCTPRRSSGCGCTVSCSDGCGGRTSCCSNCH